MIKRQYFEYNYFHVHLMYGLGVPSFYQPRAIIVSNIVSFYKLFQNPKPAHALKLIDTRGFANYLSTLLHNLVYTFQGNCMNRACNETYHPFLI